MTIKAEHEIHTRRFSRNLGVGLLLGGFVALLFALSVVKVTTLDPELARQQFGSSQIAKPAE